MGGFGLNKQKKAILAVYDVFVEICARHGLRYYMAYGTAIGVVRHTGFIPWDDDLDVVMPRPDYERFFKLAKDELPEYYKPVTWHVERGMRGRFGKVQETRREIIDAAEDELGHRLPQGIYIDIFPIDGYPETRFGERVWNFVRKVIFRFRPWVLEEFCMDMLAKSIPYGRGSMTGIFESTFRVSHPTRLAIWGDPIFGEFEGRKVPLAPGYHEWLTDCYGDYMTPPPEDKRNSTHLWGEDVPWKYG